MAPRKKKPVKFIDMYGNVHDTSMGDLKIGSKFILYGTIVAKVVSMDPKIGESSVVYEYDEKRYTGLPASRTDQAWCQEKK